MDARSVLTWRDLGVLILGTGRQFLTVVVVIVVVVLCGWSCGTATHWWLLGGGGGFLSWHGV